MKLEGKAENPSQGIWRIGPNFESPETEAVESVEPSQVSDEEEIIQPDQPDSPYEKTVGSGEGFGLSLLLPRLSAVSRIER